MTPVQFEPGWLAEEFRRAREEIATWPQHLQDLTPAARWRKAIAEEEKARTPEERMCVVWRDAMKELPDRPPTLPMPERDAIIKHGAAAIRAAVEEAAAYAFGAASDAAHDAIHDAIAEMMLCEAVKDAVSRAIEAARTGWTPP